MTTPNNGGAALESVLDSAKTCDGISMSEVMKAEEAITAIAELAAAAKPAADRLLRLCETRLRGAECAEARDDWRRLSAALAPFQTGGAE